MATNFDDVYPGNLIGLWDFLAGNPGADTGLDDGEAQDGAFKSGASASQDQLVTNGACERFEVGGNDAPFDTAQGTVILRFSQVQHNGSKPDTLLSRGEYDDRNCDGYLGITVSASGAVAVQHVDGGAQANVTTTDGFFSTGDDVEVFYSWSDTGGALKVVNHSTGAEETIDVTEALSLDIGDNNDPSFVIGAQLKNDGSIRGEFDGTIDYVAVYDANVIAPLDGVVTGTNGDDIIDLTYTGDPEGDMIDNGDAVLPGEGPDDDIVDALAGDDIVSSGLGDDTVYAGEDDDIVHGGQGDDTIYGDSTYSGMPSSEREALKWSDVPDPNGGGPIDQGDDLSGGFTLNTGSVDVTFTVLSASPGITNTFDTITEAVAGIDSDGAPVDANSGFNSDASNAGENAAYSFAFSNEVSNVSFRINDIDGDSVIRVTAYDVHGNPIDIDLTAGANLALTDTDTVAGGDTARQATQANNYDTPDDLDNSVLVEIAGPVSRIEVTHAQDNVSASSARITDMYFDAPVGAPGDDMLYGDDGSDTIYGEAGDDTLVGGADADVVYGGDGDDLISGDNDVANSGADQLFGDFGDDTFINIGEGDHIDGGEDADDKDCDTLDLTGAGEAVNPGGGYATVTYDATDPEAGTVSFFDAGGTQTGTATFENIEKVVICFTPGTVIATPKGERPVETLKVGDRVITRDNGIQEIRWIGNKPMSGNELRLAPHLRPVLIKAGSLGDGLPERDMMLSPNHRVLIASDMTSLYFDDSEVLVAAKHLTGLPGISVADVADTSYLHLLLDNHEVILSDGAWTESFQPGDYSMAGLGSAQRNEIYELFPELESDEGLMDYTAARRALKRFEARALFA